MDDATYKPDTVVTWTQQGRPTDSAVKDHAFRLWVSYGKSWRLVSQKLNIPETTLYRWGAADNWEQRRRDQAAAFLPGMTTEGAIAARMAGSNAMIRLQQISFDDLEYGIKPDLKEVQALTLIADRGGYAHVGTRQAPEIHLVNDTNVTRESLIGKSPEELMRIEQAIRDRKR